MIALPTTPGGFACVVADPPWSFSDKGSRIAPERAPGGTYETMRPADILALPVREIVAPDALLFLWTTSAHLLDGTATAVARAWGFEPKTTMVWVKRSDETQRLQIGMGHYTRASHELVVIARRGKAKVLRHDVPSVFYAPRTKHSAKPEELQGIVQHLAGGERLELFARRHRAGWTCWGDQLPALTEAA